jgi:hypothetical protein
VIARPRSRAGKKETLGRSSSVGSAPGGARRRGDARQDHIKARVLLNYFSGGRAVPFVVRPLLHDRSRRRRVRRIVPRPLPPPPSPALLLTACLPSWRPASAARIA